MGKEVEEEAAACAPDWIVTFADMISLLVTFFILLMTFSSLEAYDAFQVKGQIKGTTGTLTSGKGPSAIEPPKVDFMLAMDAARGANIPHERPTEALLDNIEEMGQKNDDEHVELDLNALEDGIVIRYGERETFKPGSVEPSSELKSAAGELARVLEHYPYGVVIEGYTDDLFVKTQRYPTAEALGLARAIAVAEEMLAKSNLNPKMIEVTGLGAMRPVESNDTPEGRRMNRRVEIRVLSMSKARVAALSRKDPSNG